MIALTKRNLLLYFRNRPGVSVGRARNPLPHVPHAEDDEMDHVEVVRQHIDDAIAEFTK